MVEIYFIYLKKNTFTINLLHSRFTVLSGGEQQQCAAHNCWFLLHRRLQNYCTQLRAATAQRFSIFFLHRQGQKGRPMTLAFISNFLIY